MTTQAAHIPFVRTPTDYRLVQKYYPTSCIIRVPLNVLRTGKITPTGFDIWVDPVVDAYDNWPPSDGKIREFLKQFDEEEDLASESFHRKPDPARLERFTNELLDSCHQFNPKWLSIPQLPMVSNASRNKVNRLLARAAAAWRSRSNFQGRMILPVIVTHKDQIVKKTKRKPKVKLVGQCCELARADGIWVVDTSLMEHKGFSTLDDERYPALIALHDELARALPARTRSIVVAGPYWGMNLVLWARAQASHPAIGVGSAYQYFVPGFSPRQAKVRVAIPSLRRLVLASPELQEWFEELVPSVSDQAFKRELDSLRKSVDGYIKNKALAREQIARSYKLWFDLLEGAPEPARKLTLYQDLSEAYVKGRSIVKSLPRLEGAARRPERIAQQLMMHVL